MSDSEKAYDDEINEVARKLHIDPDWARKITPEDIQYLLDHCPFLQMVNPDVEPESRSVELIPADSGWIIHHYGDAMSSSPGELLYGDYQPGKYNLQDDEEGDGGKGRRGRGTIVRQAFETAMQMVELAQKFGWKNIMIVDGHRIMKRAAWMMAESLGMGVKGFQPNKHDFEVRRRTEMSETQLESLRKTLKS